MGSLLVLPTFNEELYVMKPSRFYPLGIWFVSIELSLRNAWCLPREIYVYATACRVCYEQASAPPPCTAAMLPPSSLTPTSQAGRTTTSVTLNDKHPSTQMVHDVSYVSGSHFPPSKRRGTPAVVYTHQADHSASSSVTQQASWSPSMLQRRNSKASRF